LEQQHSEQNALRCKQVQPQALRIPLNFYAGKLLFESMAIQGINLASPMEIQGH